MSQGMSSSEDVLWEPAQFINENRVRLCIDGREMSYDARYMRSSGAWFVENSSQSGSSCHPVSFAETDAVFKEFSHQTAYFSKISKMAQIDRKKTEREKKQQRLKDLKSKKQQLQAKREQDLQCLKRRLGQGKDAARIIGNLFQHDEEFINEFLNSISDENRCVCAINL